MSVPVDTPVTTPVDELTDAIDVALLLHEPPVVVSARVVVEETSTIELPVIGPGTPSEETGAVATQLPIE